MAEIGLDAVLKPELDEQETRKQARGLQDELSNTDFSLTPDLELSDAGGLGPSLGDVRAGAGRAAGRRIGQSLPGRAGTAVGGSVGEWLAGAEAETGDTGGGGGTSAQEPDDAIGLMSEQLAVQEEILEEIQDMGGPGQQQGDGSSRKLLGLGLGALGGGLGGFALGSLGLGSNLISFLDDFKFTVPDIPPLEVPDIPPVPVIAPDSIPLDVPDIPPLEVPEPEPVPVDQPNPVPVDKPDPVPVDEPDPLPVDKPGPLPVEEPGTVPVGQPPFPVPVPVASPRGTGTGTSGPSLLDQITGAAAVPAAMTAGVLEDAAGPAAANAAVTGDMLEGGGEFLWNRGSEAAGVASGVAGAGLLSRLVSSGATAGSGLMMTDDFWTQHTDSPLDGKDPEDMEQAGWAEWMAEQTPVRLFGGGEGKTVNPQDLIETTGTVSSRNQTTPQDLVETASQANRAKEDRRREGGGDIEVNTTINVETRDLQEAREEAKRQVDERFKRLERRLDS